MRYPGGKGVTFRHIINQIPPHDVYIEPFFGGGAVMRNKRLANVNVGIDIDSAVIDLNSDIARDVELVCGDSLSILRGLSVNQRTFIYADPPYLLDTRRSGLIYKHEFSLDQHIELLALLLRMPCMIMLSGYYSSLYMSSLPGWRVITYQSMTRGSTAATEYLWMNYPEPVELHDYRYLGDNFREREKLTRRVKRWRSRLAKMDVLQRRALLIAIQET